MRDKTNEQLILDFILQICNKQKNTGKEIGVTTNLISEKLDIQRANVSSALNKLHREGKILKSKGKPVIYTVNYENDVKGSKAQSSGFTSVIGSEKSLKKPIQQAKAAMLYPPRGLHTLLLGPTGVGKTMFAELMYRFAVENEIVKEDAPFVSFNCADYASNPQLLLAYLFGAKKGSYTGADEDRMGLVQKADKGILFLDEVHRLPPEGQEIFFYLMDKGMYKPLGEVGDYKKVDVLIICATTENKDSSLLTTFTRRIPMVISLPALKDRTQKERFDLLSEFFQMEACRTGKEIKVTADAVKSLLLYNCVGNIGQLKNDIQLGCANGFLKCIVNGTEYIEVDLEELPEYVRKGIVNYKLFKAEIDKIVLDNSMFYFSDEGNENVIEMEQSSQSNNFYDLIEERINALKDRDLSQEDINLIMSLDIEKYFKKYIYKINQNINKEELSKVIDTKTISLVEEFLDYASRETKKVFPQRIFYGLCLHISSSIERIRSNKAIINHKIDEIMERFPSEYKVSSYLVDKLKEEYNINIPRDEIGFITMFITDEFINQQNRYEKSVVLIAMHGNSTASSMADVVNKLIGGESTFAYDMPLDKSTDTAYKELKEYIVSINQGGGVLLLADMGSLTMFGEVISEETGIKIRAIDMVTTLIALEAGRKASIGVGIDEIYNEIMNKSAFNLNYNNDIFPRSNGNKDNVVITMCITGEGSAVKLKNMIENQLYLEDENIQVIPVSIIDREDMISKVKRISKDKNILVVVGTINPELHGIPFISASELFMDKDYNRLKGIIKSNHGAMQEEQELKDICQQVLESFREDIKSYDLNTFYQLLLKFISSIERGFNLRLDIDTLVGLTMHLACAIERIISNKGEVLSYSKKPELIALYKNDLEALRLMLISFERSFNVSLNENELWYIYTLIKKI
jgi:transcriptional regulatory protein LevR/transcriptional regulator with AAA-type ATPase domain